MFFNVIELYDKSQLEKEAHKSSNGNIYPSKIPKKDTDNFWAKTINNGTETTPWLLT